MSLKAIISTQCWQIGRGASRMENSFSLFIWLEFFTSLWPRNPLILIFEFWNIARDDLGVEDHFGFLWRTVKPDCIYSAILVTSLPKVTVFLHKRPFYEILGVTHRTVQSKYAVSRKLKNIVPQPPQQKLNIELRFSRKDQWQVQRVELWAPRSEPKTT